jgi:hypothetical protein
MQTYKSAATARRGAFRQKLNPNEFTVEQGSDGLWFIKTSELASEPLPTEPAPSVEAKATKTKMPQPKATKATRQRLSTSNSPVAFIWNWLSQGDNAKLGRSEAIRALAELGIARGTASTQRQRFLNASDAERQARMSRYAEGSDAL